METYGPHQGETSSTGLATQNIEDRVLVVVSIFSVDGIFCIARTANLFVF